MTENLINRISFYLASGGLFNPELADHIAVRTLLFECREALAQRTWVGLTNEELTDLFYNTNLGQQSAVGQAIELLRERNT